MPDIVPEIIYRDDDLLVVNKPAGVHVHRSDMSGRELVLLQAVRDAVGAHVYPVHRLDLATSGLVLFALSSGTAGELCALLRQHEIHRTYLAVVRGHCAAEGVIDNPVPVGKAERRVAAATRFRLLATSELMHPVGPYQTARYSLLEVEPQTGRRHQIRRHFRHISHPLVGDTTYGDNEHNTFFRNHFGVGVLFLHAWKLEVPRGDGSVPLRVTAPVPPAWHPVLSSIGWGCLFEPSRV